MRSLFESVLFVFCFLAEFNSLFSSKLNVRRVLLPFNIGVPTNYTLEVFDGGCYQWSSSRSDVATVNPIYENAEENSYCSRKAYVSVVYHSPKRQSTVVIASDPTTGQTFRADVVVDVIKSIEIVTTTKEIALDDVPEIFEVQAKNDENDTFSCLGGIEFEWTFEPIAVESSNGVTSNLRFRKFADSPYEVPSSIKYWESRESHGHKVLIQGIKTGASYVRARIVDQEYKNIPPSEIVLVVIANLVLVPSQDVFLIPASTIKYGVNMIKGGQTHKISIPSEQYYFELSDTNVASLNVDTSVVTAVKEGSTSIILKDRNIKPGGGVRQPISEIHIRKPSYLLFKVHPGQNWALQEFTLYIVTVQIFDEYHHKMYPSENLELKVTFPSKYFHVNFSTPNGTYHIVKTINPGVTKIKAELLGCKKDDKTIEKLAIPISVEQDVHIYQTLRISPPLILLPWDPVEKPSYTVYATATGATGVFHWESSNPDIATVAFRDGKNSARATIVTRGIGDTILKVTDHNNDVFQSNGRISIQPIAEIDIAPTILETQIGSSVILPLRLYGYEDESKKKVLRVFDDCSKVPISVEVIEKTRFTYVEDEESIIPGTKSSCRTLRFECKNVGHSRIWVKYSTPDEKINLKTTAVISCHLPLKIIHPEPLGVLSLGSSVEITFEGGPRPWPLHKEGHYTRLTPDIPSIFAITPITDPYRYKKDLHVFRVVCKDLGESEIELAVGNLATATLPNPAVQKETVRIACSFPSKLFLKPKLKSDDSCPLISNSASGSSLKVPVSSNRDTEIEVFTKDKNDRIFLNITSLRVTWKISDLSIGKLNAYQDFIEEVNGANGYRRWNRNYQIFHPLNKEGEVLVEAKIEGYRKDVLSQGAINTYSEIEKISSKVTLTIVDKPSVEPEEVAALNHPNNKINVQITKGSGHFQIDVSSPDYANISYFETSKRITIIPKKDGIMSIKVTDSCVDHGSTTFDAMTTLRIVNAKEIRVFMADKVEAGKEVDIKVQVVDTRGEVIPSSLHKLMNLHPVTVSDVITVKPKVSLKSDHSYSWFTLKAEKVGRTSLVFKTEAQTDSANYAKIITSQEVIIQVFLPLRIVPSNISLVVGSIFQVTIVGGPQPEGVIAYNVENDAFATVSGSGMIEARKIGVTKLTAKAVGPNFVYSQDTVTIEVLPLLAISIAVPSQQLLVDEEMPLFITARSSNPDKSFSPFTFGSANPPFRISWSASNKDIVHLRTVYEEIGVSGSISDNVFAVRLKGVQSGLVNIRVTMEVTKEAPSNYVFQSLNNKKLSDEVQIRVFSKLDLLANLERKSGGLILMAPGSELPLKTSRQGFAKVSHILKPASTKIFIEKGSILKAEEMGETTLEVKAIEDFGVTQTSDYRVHVKPVSFLMVKPTTRLISTNENDHQLIEIPIGFTMNFRVSFHDNVGKPYDAVQANIRVRPSRFDLINIISTNEEFNNSITIRALKEGLTVLRVWDSLNVGTKILEDYIYIRSGHSIFPNDPRIYLTVGDIICFSSPLRTAEGQTGVWEVEGESDALSIDFHTGTAIARKSGQVRVKHNLSTFTTTSSLVVISVPQFVHLETSSVSYFTNSKIDQTVNIPIILGAHSKVSRSHCKEEKIKEHLSKFQPPFDCNLIFTSPINGLNDIFNRELQAMDLFNCQIAFNFAKNFYEAKITVREDMNEPQLRAALAIVENNITLVVNMLLLGNDIQSFESLLPITVTLPFYPAFYISSDEIVLTNEKPLAYLSVVGTPQILQNLEVVAANDDTKKIIDIFPMEHLKSDPTTVNIPIQISDASWLWRRDSDSPLAIRVLSSLSRQVKLVPLKIRWNTDGPNCPVLPRQSLSYSKNKIFSVFFGLLHFSIEYYQILLTSISTCAVMFIGYHWFLRRSQRGQPVPFLQPHNLTASSSPFASSTISSPQRREGHYGQLGTAECENT
ncbi:nuclear pore membrane glycoprotein 210-like protein [Dinothrombium tinctorium]|uniref:Nuclear pore membrane glycoprotein 210-like protein n=1 Tax=Dinothrombium tinctorium TaxID=1965070 RepID=A0A3S3P7V1_9ACAR|nr:nuclear pore membrane glycoprotein 210-like protein [Dinothrombium tinctorium]